MRKTKFVSVFSWIICFTLLFSNVFPLYIFAQSKPNNSLSYLQHSQLPKNKISNRLMEEFKKKKMVTFLVKLKSQVNTTKIANEVQKKYTNKKVTAYKRELSKRSSIVSNLRATAYQTQKNLIQYVENEKKAGSVKKYTSYYIVNAVSITGTKKVLEEISKRTEVEKILPNETRKLIGKEAVKVAPKKNKNPLTHRTKPQSIEWNIERVGAPQVWNMGIDGKGTVIANIDTGVQWDHPGLKEKYRGYKAEDPSNPEHIYNWYDATNNQSVPYDDLGHGTHTMGTMVGGESTGNNQVGVAPGAKWIAVKAFSNSGGTDEDLLRAGEWIIAPKDGEGNPHPEKAPDVVNNSWGGGPGLDEWYRPMVQNWRAAGIFPEFSAGNTTFSNPGGPRSVANPANYPESFATGATDSSNNLATFSLQGPSPYNELKPEISAPGVNIRSTVPGSKYESGWSGTSMAGPHVSAIVALLKQANSSLTVDQMEDILISTATPLTDSKFPDTPNNGYGYGLVSALDAVSTVLNGIGEISGRVTKDGNDSEKPTYKHNAPKVAFESFPITLTLIAKDNVSITKIELLYQSKEGEDWKRITPNRIAGNYQTGIYQAKINASEIIAPKLTYYWKINDFGNNLVTTPHYNVNVFPGLTKGYQNDFDSDSDEWYSFGQNNTWECGKPKTGPKKAFAGENIYASNLEGNYKENTDATLVMPPIDVPKEGGTFLQFKQWYDLESSYDFGRVLLSKDLEKWEELTKVTGSSNDWVDQEVDLSSYKGEKIYIGFNLKTDSLVNRIGWFLDHVCITETSLNLEDTPEPTVLKRAPKNTTILKTHGKKKKSLTKQTQTGLPLEARISILETGRSINTRPEDGGFNFKHPSGHFTLRAESYGYFAKDATIEVPRDGSITQNFHLDAIPKGTVQGKIKNKMNGSPISGATLFLMEDAVITPVQTDKNGIFTLKGYEGDYTLRIIAPNYYRQDIPITIKGNTSVEKDIDLKPFIGYPGELSYDDGTAENAHAFYDPGNGWAVKMSLDPEKAKSAMVTSGLFRFWNTEWPDPGGEAFEVAVYDATGLDGAPGKKIAGPFKASALRNGAWTEVDLSGKSIFVTGDFYMVYIQSTSFPESPGLAADENGANTERSYQLIGDAWSLVPPKDGNYMIRAKVNYEVNSPNIHTPTNKSFTNQSTIDVKGKTTPNITVHIQNKGKEAGSGVSNENGSFSIPISLTKGENVITATSSTNQGATEPCSPVTIILDQTKPIITVHSPTDGLKTNRETFTITGNANDQFLESVKINGKSTQLDKDGHYSLRTMLHLGENQFTIVATDKAGNESKKEITVDANFLPLKVHDFTPNNHVTLTTGDTLKIEFTSVAHLKGTYSVNIPLTHLPQTVKENLTQLPIHEEADGHYVAYWTVPKHLVNIKGATLEINVHDEYGNKLRKLAKGKLNLNVNK